MENNNSPESVALNEGDYVVAIKPWNNYHALAPAAGWINPSGKVMIVRATSSTFKRVMCEYLTKPFNARHIDNNWWFENSSLIKITPEQANDPNFRRWMYACYSGDTEPLKEVE